MTATDEFKKAIDENMRFCDKMRNGLRPPGSLCRNRILCDFYNVLLFSYVRCHFLQTLQPKREVSVCVQKRKLVATDRNYTVEFVLQVCLIVPASLGNDRCRVSSRPRERRRQVHE
jgi:hypothetical protein